MRLYSLNNLGVIGGRENDSPIYVKNVFLDTNHNDSELHSHPDSDEYYIVLTGKILFKYSSEEKVVEGGEVICFKKNELHQIVKVLTPSKVLIIKLTDTIRTS